MRKFVSVVSIFLAVIFVIASMSGTCSADNPVNTLFGDISGTYKGVLKNNACYVDDGTKLPNQRDRFTRNAPAGLVFLGSWSTGTQGVDYYCIYDPATVNPAATNFIPWWDCDGYLDIGPNTNSRMATWGIWPGLTPNGFVDSWSGGTVIIKKNRHGKVRIRSNQGATEAFAGPQTCYGFCVDWEWNGTEWICSREVTDCWVYDPTNVATCNNRLNARSIELIPSPFATTAGPIIKSASGDSGEQGDGGAKRGNASKVKDILTKKGLSGETAERLSVIMTQ